MIERNVMHPFGHMIISSNNSELFDFNFDALVEMVNKHKIVVLRDFFELNKEQFIKFCQNFSDYKFLEWNFGPVMEMKENENPSNYLFSREEVPYHWDGAFYTVPDFLVFSCVSAPKENAGGETLFANTEDIYNSLSPATQKNWAKVFVEYATEKIAHYGGNIKVPLIQKHPHLQTNIIRYAEAVTTKLNPVQLTVHGLENNNQDMFTSEMREKLYHSQFCYQHLWKTGDILIADNHSLVHGRKAFSANSTRHLRRIQLIKNN